MAQESAVVAMYDTHDRAEAAVKTLRDAAVDLKNISIIGAGGHDRGQVVGYVTSGSQGRHVGGHGTFWNAICTLLEDTGTFYLPGTGPIMVAGPVVGWIVGALEGAAQGAERLVHAVEGEDDGASSALGQALIGKGIPQANIREYERAVIAGRFVLIVHGTAVLTGRARTVLDQTDAAEVTAFDR